MLIMAIALFISFGAASADSTPDEAYISGLVGHAQSLSLSCESRSAADWAAFWGLSISELDFLEKLPRSDNPNEGFVGNPNDDWGYRPPYSYGVHAEPVARILRNLGLDAHAGSGLSWEEIRDEVAVGRPVIVWVIGSVYSGSANNYQSADGQDILVAAFEHTMILIGYDSTTVHLVDAFTGLTVSHPLDNFLESWSVLNNMAVVGRGSLSDKIITESIEKDDEIKYVVQKGDTLAKIASAWDISWQEIAANNHLSYPYMLPVGQELLILSSKEKALDNAPEIINQLASSPHVVQSGEHLMSIARDMDVDWLFLAEFNALEAPYLLFPGDELQIPIVDLQKVSVELESKKDALPESLTVTFSESVYSFAHRFNLSWMDIAWLNDIVFPYILQIGQDIQLR